MSSGSPAKIENAAAPDSKRNTTDGILVTMFVDDQIFGIPVLQIQDILGPQRITRVPLAPPEVMGSLNLRGRIVTAVDLRTRLGLPPRAVEELGMNVVVEYDGELYSMVVDKVGEVMNLLNVHYENNPPTLDAQWRNVSNGIYHLKDRLLIILDVAQVLNLAQSSVT
jgi:purine-binding chemotaxis protein CheW